MVEEEGGSGGCFVGALGGEVGNLRARVVGMEMGRNALVAEVVDDLDE